MRPWLILSALAAAVVLAAVGVDLCGAGDAVAQSAAPKGAVAPAAAPKPGRTPLPAITKGRGDKCVAPTDWMRRFHMTALSHKRDDTVHDGIRTPQFSLKGCIDCHAVNGTDGKPVTVKDERHFCRTCHDYAAVKVDCFECHASRPDGSIEKKGADAGPIGGERHPELARLRSSLGEYLAEGTGAQRP